MGKISWKEKIRNKVVLRRINKDIRLRGIRMKKIKMDWSLLEMQMSIDVIEGNIEGKRGC